MGQLVQGECLGEKFPISQTSQLQSARWEGYVDSQEGYVILRVLANIACLKLYGL